MVLPADDLADSFCNMLLPSVKNLIKNISGTKMPISLCSAAVVISPNNGLMILGGQEFLKRNDSKATQNKNILSLRNSDLMLEVVVNTNESMEWRILPQKLERPRNQPIALLIPDELTHCSNSSNTYQKNNGKVTKSVTSLHISTKLLIFLVILWGGTVCLPAFIFCKGHLLNTNSEQPEENPAIDTNRTLSLTRSDSHITSLSLVENSKYEKLSSIIEICIIPSSQIKMKKEIGMAVVVILFLKST